MHTGDVEGVRKQVDFREQRSICRYCDHFSELKTGRVSQRPRCSRLDFATFQGYVCDLYVERGKTPC